MTARMASERRADPRPFSGPERRLAAVHELDERFRELVELAPDGLLVHDGERITWVNAAALRLAGATTPGELVGQPVSLVLDPPHLKALADQLAGGVRETAPAAPVRDVLRRLDGSTVPVEVRARGFIHRGAPAVHLVLRDITERLALDDAARRVEAGIQQVTRAEALGTLAGGVAHELNNLIAIVLGHGALALEERDDAAGVRADVREMMKAADRAATVTRQLLAFSQHAVHRPEVIGLDDAVRDIEPALARLLGPGRRLELRLSPVSARIDPTHLAQVLLALASNARDATSEQGEVIVSVRGTTLSQPLAAAGGRSIPPGRFAELVVADDGAVIPPSVHERMFEPFFTTKPPGEGAGLGLAAVQGILAQNGGFVLAESEAGSGATFRVFLREAHERPAASVPPVPSRPARPASPRAPDDRRGRTVLVVDDEPAIRAMVARVLRQAGLRTRLASDGREALASIEREGLPDLVLTDLQMPGMGGLELRRAIRERWADLPMLLMSGYSAEYLRADGRAGEEDVLVQKPFTPAELTARVAAALALSGEAGRSPSA